MLKVGPLSYTCAIEAREKYETHCLLMRFENIGHHLFIKRPMQAMGISRMEALSSMYFFKRCGGESILENMRKIGTPSCDIFLGRVVLDPSLPLCYASSMNIAKILPHSFNVLTKWVPRWL